MPAQLRQLAARRGHLPPHSACAAGESASVLGHELQWSAEFQDAGTAAPSASETSDSTALGERLRPIGSLVTAQLERVRLIASVRLRANRKFHRYRMRYPIPLSRPYNQQL